MLKASTWSLIGAVIAVLVTPAPTTAQTRDWKAYENTRYGFAACYPGGASFSPPEAPNGDGITRRYPDGTEILIYGSNNAFGETLTEYVATSADMYRNSAGVVTLSRVRGHIGVVSGVRRDTIFYERTVARDDQYLTLMASYPKRRAAAWNPIVERMAACFVASRPAF